MKEETHYTNKMDGFISKHITGEGSKKIFLTDKGERIIEFPLVMFIFVLILFDVPSWILGVLLLLTLILNIDITVRRTKKKDKTIVVDNSKVQDDEKVEPKIQNYLIEEDKDGYNQITIGENAPKA